MFYKMFVLFFVTFWATSTDAVISKIIMDAGSTSTRIYLFIYKEGSDFQMIKLSSIRPGIQDFVGRVHEVLPRIERKMIRALEHVDSESEIDVYLYATGGVRKLPLKDQTSLLQDFVDEFAKIQGPFRLQEAATISGLEEAWSTLVGVNFAANVPVGVLDLGGASTQVVIPNGEVNICGQRPDDVAAHSFPGFGGDSIREKFLEYSKEISDDSPCFLPGDQKECYKKVSSFVDHMRKNCKGEACLSSSQEFQIENFEFYAVSMFHYVYDFLQHFGLQDDGTLLDFTNAAESFCKMEPSSLNETKLVESKKTATYQIPRRCFEANYILVLLREVYGFPLEGVRIHFVERVGGKYLEWVTGVFVKNVMCTIENLDQKSEL